MQEQASEFGYDEAHIIRTNGMVVHPAYYQRREDVLRSGVVWPQNPLPTIVLFFGGYGPPRMRTIAERLLRQFELKLIILVGKNEQLLRSFESQPLWSSDRVLVAGFVPPETLIEYLSTAVCVIGKPGPGTVSEAAVLRVPFVTEQNESTLPQEVCVIKYMRRMGIGVVLDSLEGPYPVDLFEKLNRCRRTLRKYRNEAVFDVCASIVGLVNVD